MPADMFEIVVDGEDLAELDRLAAYFTDGDRSAFLREAMRVLAERLDRPSPEA